jgi:hypothetical protein
MSRIEIDYDDLTKPFLNRIEDLVESLARTNTELEKMRVEFVRANADAVAARKARDEAVANAGEQNSLRFAELQRERGKTHQLAEMVRNEMSALDTLLAGASLPDDVMDHAIKIIGKLSTAAMEADPEPLF